MTQVFQGVHIERFHCTVYVCMYVCVYVCMYVCMQFYMYNKEMLTKTAYDVTDGSMGSVNLHETSPSE